MTYDKKLGRALILDELFDLTLYKRLRKDTKGDVAGVLEELIETETRHRKFWEDFFSIRVEKLNFMRHLKLSALLFLCRLFGETGIRLVLEATEVYGIRKYLQVWRTYEHKPLGEAVKQILRDEFEHEDTIVQKITGGRIKPERIRDIFLGFNDGLVEVLGAISGFFAAFQSTASVLVAGMTVAIAGAISMAAGAYAAMGSEREIEKTQKEKHAFLSGEKVKEYGVHPLNSAFVVGISYFFGALVPIAPVLLGASNIFASIVIASVMIIIVSTLLAFFSGMDTRKRIMTNLVIIAIAVSVTYTIGLFAREFFGVSL